MINVVFADRMQHGIGQSGLAGSHTACDQDVLLPGNGFQDRVLLPLSHDFVGDVFIQSENRIRLLPDREDRGLNDRRNQCLKSTAVTLQFSFTDRPLSRVRRLQHACHRRNDRYRPYPQKRNLPAKVRVFVDFLATHFEEKAGPRQRRW